MKTGFYKVVDAVKADLVASYSDGDIVEITWVDIYGDGYDDYGDIIATQQDLDNGSIVYLGESDLGKNDFEEFKSRCIASGIDVPLHQMETIYKEVVIGTDWK